LANATLFDKNRNGIEFRVWGKYALFTDPVTKIGGEKCSYHVPTYEALKGVVKSIYWKPSIVWIIDEVRVVNRIQTQTKALKPLQYHGIYPSEKDPSKKKEEPFSTLSIYNYLFEVEYQVRAHFEWNEHRPELKDDWNRMKHFSIAQRMLERGGRQDIFLGVRDAQGYVEPCEFGEGNGFYDDAGELAFGIMFHGFDYPDETGDNELHARLWNPVMRNGYIVFPRPETCDMRRFIRPMHPKKFSRDKNFKACETEAREVLDELDT